MYIFYPNKLIYCHSGVAIIRTVTRECFKKSGLLVSRESFVFLVFQEGNQGYKQSSVKVNTSCSRLAWKLASWYNLFSDFPNHLKWNSSSSLQMRSSHSSQGALDSIWGLFSSWICYYSVGFFWLEYKGLWLKLLILYLLALPKHRENTQPFLHRGQTLEKKNQLEASAMSSLYTFKIKQYLLKFLECLQLTMKCFFFVRS